MPVRRVSDEILGRFPRKGRTGGGDVLPCAAVRTHDDHPGTGGGYPDDRYYGGTAAAPGGNPPVQPTAPMGSQSSGASDFDDYYDDDAYSTTDPSMLGDYDDYDDELDDRRGRFGWNGGTDLGLLILRLALGGVFIAHGAQKLFGAFGGPGPEGFAQSLRKMGFEQSTALSLVTGATELGGGALLVLGLFTPLAAAGLVGVMVNALVVKFDGAFFASSGGVEYELVLGSLALGLLFTGPGRAALDKGRSWFRHPLASGGICLLLAAAASAVVLLVLH